MMLVPPTQRNSNPSFGIHGPQQPLILQGPQKDWSASRWLSTRKGTIQHNSGI